MISRGDFAPRRGVYMQLKQCPPPQEHPHDGVHEQFEPGLVPSPQYKLRMAPIRLIMIFTSFLV